MSKTGRVSGDQPFGRGALYLMLQNRVYLGEITHKGESYPGQQPAIIDHELWDKVQEQLKSNLQGERKRSRGNGASLLLGLLYDADGNRFTPAHANKAGRRYHYYVAQVTLKADAKNGNGPTRLPAKEIEELVRTRLRLLLQSPQQLQDALGVPSDPKQLKLLVEAAARATVKLDEIASSILRSVVVHKDRIEIQIGKAELLRSLLGKDVEIPAATLAHAILAIESAATLRRHGGEMRLQLPPGEQGSKSRPVPPLIRAVARANDWVDRILKGELDNGKAISKATGFDERYVSRILPLAFLSPEITEAILDGSLHSQLRDCPTDTSLEWAMQRAQLAR